MKEEVERFYEKKKKMDKVRSKIKMQKLVVLDNLGRSYRNILEKIKEKNDEIIGKTKIVETMFSKEVKTYIYEIQNMQMIAFFNLEKIKFEKEIKEAKKKLKILEEQRTQIEFEYFIAQDQYMIL